MNITLDYLTGNRKWLIRDFTIWGNVGSFDAALAASEDANPDRIVFMRELVGGDPQIVEFADLLDHRGNRVPDTIGNAEIIIVPKSEIVGFVVGAVGPSSFRVAKGGTSSPDALVDLIIMEMN